MESISLELESGLRWYAVQTKPRNEVLVERRLRDLSLEVFLPWLRSRRRIGSRYQWVLIPLFPNYLFCRLDIVLYGKNVRYASGVRDFVKFGNRIAEVELTVIQALRDRCPGGVAQIQRSYKPGDPVRIQEGPFSDLEAVFEEALKGSERVAILLEILGRQTRLVISSDMIGRA